MSDSCDPWTAAHQAPLSMGFPRQEYWSVLPLSSPGDLPDSGIEPVFPALTDGFFTTQPAGKPKADTIHDAFKLLVFIDNKIKAREII